MKSVPSVPLALRALAASALTLMTACSPEKKDESPPLVTSVAPELIDSEAAVAKKAEEIKLYYADDHRVFGAFDLREPCRTMDLETFAALEAETQKTFDALAPDAERSRDVALDFFRKIEAQLESLKELNQLLGEFCAADFDAAKACFKHERPLRITINQKVAGYLPIHPHLLPSERSKVALLILEQEATAGEAQVRTADAASGSLATKHPFAEMATNTSLRELQEIATCFEGLELPSAVGAHARETALRASRQARVECLTLKAKIAAGEAIPSGDEFEFCGDLMKNDGK